MLGAFFKRKEEDGVWWIEDLGTKGKILFSFDRKKIYNFFRDYPHNLTKEEKEIFDKADPYLAAFYEGKRKI